MFFERPEKAEILYDENHVRLPWEYMQKSDG
jgi:hypothetical protein